MPTLTSEMTSKPSFKAFTACRLPSQRTSRRGMKRCLRWKNLWALKAEGAWSRRKRIRLAITNPSFQETTRTPRSRGALSQLRDQWVQSRDCRPSWVTLKVKKNKRWSGRWSNRKRSTSTSKKWRSKTKWFCCSKSRLRRSRSKSNWRSSIADSNPRRSRITKRWRPSRQWKSTKKDVLRLTDRLAICRCPLTGNLPETWRRRPSNEDL